MNKLRSLIANTFGLVDPDEIRSFVQTEIGKTKAGVSGKDRPPQRASYLIGQPVAPEMGIQDYIKAYHGWVFSCVRVIAEETADIKLRLYRRKNQSEFEIVEQHQVLDLLYKVNPMYTSYLMWEATAAYMELTGETFWYLGGKVNNPKEIWVLRPDWVSVKDTKGSIIESYLYGPPGDNKMTIPFEQMIHFKDFNPNNWYRGFGTVRPADKAVATDEFAATYNQTFFYNSAMPAGALKTDQTMTDEQQEQLRDQWEAVHRGEKKAWKVAILWAGLEWQDIGMNRKEMDFIEGRRLSRDEIMAMFRVPKPLLTFDDVNRAAAKEARAILLENVITHKMRRICTFLNEFLLPRYGDDSLFFDYENPVPNDETLTINKHKAELAGAPWRTVNEVRDDENLEPIEGGDKLMVPFSMQDSGNSLSPDAQKKQKLRKLFSFNVRIPTYPYIKYQTDQLQERLQLMVEKLLVATMVKRRAEHAVSTKTTKEVQDADIVTEDVREARWKTLVSRTDPREAEYTKLIGNLFSEQEDRVMDRINEELKKSLGHGNVVKEAEYKAALGKVKSNIDDITDLSGDDKIFVETLMKFIRSVIETEGILQIQSLVSDAVFYMQTQAIKRYLKTEGVKYIAAINEETASQLRDELIEAVDKGESIAQIRVRVEKVYEDARGYRATRIARSEVLRATNFATEQAYIQSDVVEKKEWLTAKDERVCPWCGPMDGKQIELKKVFFEEGDTIRGKNENGKTVTMTVGVSDVSAPPLHPNCRCTLIPVLKQD